MNIKNSLFILILIGILLLQGCVSAVATSANAVYHRNTLGNRFENQYIALQINNLYQNDLELSQSCNLNATAFNYVVLLTGQAPTPALREKAERLARQVDDDIKRIVNQITLEPPIGPEIKANDAWITTVIKAQMIAANDLDPSQFKVITENSTVFLMGTITPPEAESAISIARNTEGVQKVVKVLTYLRESNQ